MKGLSTLITFHAFLATVCGVLISQMSFVGRMGITFFYKNYGILKIWWQTALLIFLIHVIFIGVFYIFKRILPRKFSLFLFILLAILGFIGLYFTYENFRTGTYKLMRNNFHVGFYLFWLGWELNCFYFMIVRRKSHILTEKPIEKEYET